MIEDRFGIPEFRPSPDRGSDSRSKKSQVRSRIDWRAFEYIFFPKVPSLGGLRHSAIRRPHLGFCGLGETIEDRFPGENIPSPAEVVGAGLDRGPEFISQVPSREGEVPSRIGSDAEKIQVRSVSSRSDVTIEDRNRCDKSRVVGAVHHRGSPEGEKDSKSRVVGAPLHRGSVSGRKYSKSGSSSRSRSRSRIGFWPKIYQVQKKW